MSRHPVVRRLRLLVLLLPVTAALAQAPPPLTPLPPPPVPPGNPITAAKANLGKVLFWEEQMSSTRTVACGSCHQAKVGGSDPRSHVGAANATNPGNDGLVGTADDITGSPGVPRNLADGSYALSTTFGMQAQVTPRRTPSHIDAGYSPLLFWDGRASGTFVDPVSGVTVLNAGAALESQAAGPPLSSTEMAHETRDWTQVATRIASATPLRLSLVVPSDLSAYIGGRTYPQLFQEAFGTPGVTPSRIAMAIATYERTLFSNQTPLDVALAGGAPLTPQEVAGQNLFGSLGCAGCHAGSLFSDNQFHYIGESPAAEDSGRFVITRNIANLGMFRTPSLRNAALRPSFMHDGRFSTLSQVIDFYDRGGDFNAPNRAVAIRPLALTPQMKAQLLAFLTRPLTDLRVANGTAPFDRPSLFSESELVPQVLAGGVVGTAGALPQPVAVEPPFTGNSDFTVGLFGGLGGASAVLVIDAVEPPVSGGIPSSGSFARIVTTLGGTGAGAGFGSLEVPIANTLALQGQVLYGRWYVSDAGAIDGIAASPAFRFQIFGPGGAGVLAVGSGSTPNLPRGLRLMANAPNPFGPSTSIRYELYAASAVKLTLFDAQGRVVRQLVNESLQMSGQYAIQWDGRDDGGRALPGGVYFSRLEAAGTVDTRRVVRVD